MFYVVFWVGGGTPYTPFVWGIFRQGAEDAKGFFLVSLLKYITLPPSKNGDCRWASNKTEKSRGRFGVRRNIFLRRTGYFYLVF